MTDPLLHALCEHHYELAPKELKNRFLPALPLKRVWKRREPQTVIALGNMNMAGLSGPKSLQDLAYEVCAQHNVPVEHIMSESRKRHILLARWEYFYRARQETHYSYKRIGETIGWDDHSTIINAVRKFAKAKELPPVKHERPVRAPVEVKITITLPPEAAAQVGQLANNKRVSRAAMIREIVIGAL